MRRMYQNIFLNNENSQVSKIIKFTKQLKNVLIKILYFLFEFFGPRPFTGTQEFEEFSQNPVRGGCGMFHSFHYYDLDQTSTFSSQHSKPWYVMGHGEINISTVFKQYFNDQPSVIYTQSFTKIEQHQLENDSLDDQYNKVAILLHQISYLETIRVQRYEDSAMFGVWERLEEIVNI